MNTHPLVSFADLRPLIVTFGCLALATPVFAAPLAYELNFNTSIYRVNAANNNEIFYGNAPFISESLALSPTLALYSADPNGVIWNITGSPVPVGPTGFTQVADLDWANNGLWGFSNPGSSLFFFDLGLNTVTYSAAIAGLGGSTVTGVAHDAATGDIYLSANTGLNTDQLLKIPFATTTALPTSKRSYPAGAVTAVRVTAGRGRPASPGSSPSVPSAGAGRAAAARRARCGRSRRAGSRPDPRRRRAGSTRSRGRR